MTDLRKRQNVENGNIREVEELKRKFDDKIMETVIQTLGHEHSLIILSRILDLKTDIGVIGDIDVGD